MEGRFHVLTASDGSEAVQILERENVAVLMCDQRMPEMTGIEVCRRAREIKPDVVRIIVTAYADLQAATDAINQGQVLRYLTKPWRNEELAEVLGAAVELVRMRRLVQDMQTRLLRGGHPPLLEAMARQIATELRDQVSSLEMNAEHVGDLLSAGLSTWDSSSRAKELVRARAGDASRVGARRSRICARSSTSSSAVKDYRSCRSQNHRTWCVWCARRPES
jgi:YesN/AraC family two-component response regulator